MSHYQLGLLRYFNQSIFKPGVVFNIVRPYTEKEIHSLNESSGQILKIVQNTSTENLPRYSASYQTNKQKTELLPQGSSKNAIFKSLKYNVVL